MKPTSKLTGALGALLVFALTFTSPLFAFRGRGAAFVIGAAAGSSSASAANANAAAANQQAAAAQQQAAVAQQEAAAAQQEAAAAQQQLALEKEKTAAAEKEAELARQQAVAPGTPLPLGTVVAVLPDGCTPTPLGEKNYYYCGGNFYEPVFEGSNLKYVTTKPQ